MVAVYAFSGILLLLLLVVILSALRESDGQQGGRHELTAVERRDTALEALRQLEFEYQTGKMPEAEYRELHRQLALTAVRAREAAEAASPSEATTPEPAAQVPATPEPATPDGGACALCGSAVVPADRFCTACGAAVAAGGSKLDSG